MNIMCVQQQVIYIQTVILNIYIIYQSNTQKIQTNKNPQKMSQWLKLVQCKYTPSQTFCLFDYTKIVYPIDNTFYIKQIITQQQKSSFIQINHSYDKILQLHASLNNIITIQKKGQYFYVCFYALENQEIIVRINLQGQGNINNYQVKSIYMDNLLIICFVNNQNSNTMHSNQIVFVNCQHKVIVGRGFLDGYVYDYCAGPNNSISLWVDKKIYAYKNQNTASFDIIGRIYKEIQIDIIPNILPTTLPNSSTLSNQMSSSIPTSSLPASSHPNNQPQIQHHFWIEDQLFLWGKTKAYIVIKNKICQQFDNFHRLHYAAPLVCGFLVCDGCIIKVYKKQNIKYQKICEIIDQNLMDCKNFMLSRQEDILAYFSPISNGLIVSTTFSKQIEQSQSLQNPLQMAITLIGNQITHNKNYDYTIYTSTQPWFASVSGTTIKLLSSHNYQQYLTIELSDKSGSNFINSDLKPRYLAIHPSRPIFVIALKKCVRIYFVTFNQVKIIKQIPVSLAGFLVFNHSGSLLTIVVAGKGGAKLYVYKINQFKSDFTLLETITVGKRLVAIFWDSLDTTLYYFFPQGYYTFTLQSKLKTRKQIKLPLNYPIQNALLSKQDQPIVYSTKKISILQNQSIKQQQQLKIKQALIKNVLLQEQYYYIVFDNGKIGRNKNLDIQDCYAKAVNLNHMNKKYQVRLQQNNKFIYLTEDLNVKFYQLVSTGNHNSNGNAGFVDIVGIQKKKLYNIMTKHKHYQKTIKSIKQQFTSIVLQFKHKTLQQQIQIQQQYKTQLNEHIQKQRKLKQEKIKQQERYQKNLQIRQKQSMSQIKQLQKLYERKIALTTNKLLTQKQIGFRQKSLAQDQLKILEQKHYQDIEQIRKQFAEYIKNQMFDKTSAYKEINIMKKDYQTRLYQLEEQNQILLKSLQQKNESSIIGLKKIVNNWENKYSQCVSQKDNIEKQYQEQAVKCQIYKQKLQFMEMRKIQSERRSETLCIEIQKLQKILEQRNFSLQFYEKRIQDLQKSNQILKYRVLQVKQQNDPYQSEIQKLKQNLTDLQEQYDKILKSAHEQQQKIQILKKQKSKLKQDSQIINQKYFKLNKRYEQLVDKVRQTTKSPIQQIRRQLLNIVQNYGRGNKSHSHIQKRADSPLGQLNRIRDHLQVCLDEAVSTSKKNDEQRKIEVMKKNRQNSELITQINTMRKKIRLLEDQIKQKNLKISRLIRGQTPTIVSKDQQIQTTQAQSKQFTKTRSRQTFYQKNMFKSGMQWNKRLKTQQGSRRKKSSHSMMRDRNQHSLAIQSQGEQIEEYKRIIQQKDIFIQKLIAKIQKG